MWEEGVAGAKVRKKVVCAEEPQDFARAAGPTAEIMERFHRQSFTWSWRWGADTEQHTVDPQGPEVLAN